MQARYAEQAGEPHKITLHAEIAAIVKCRNLDRAYKISVFRYNKKGNPLLAKPCPICMSAIQKTKIRDIEWTVNN